MKKTYNINGKTFFQQELNLGQDEQISLLLDELDIKNLEDFNQMSINNLIRLLLGKSLLVRFFAIILLPENQVNSELSDAELKKIPNSLAMEIIEDFFTLNAELLNTLKNLLGGLVGTKATPTSQSFSPKEKTKSSPSSEKLKH